MPVHFALFGFHLYQQITKKNFFTNTSFIFYLAGLKYCSGWDSKKQTKFATEIWLKMSLNLLNLIKYNVITITAILLQDRKMNSNLNHCNYFLCYCKFFNRILHSRTAILEGTKNLKTQINLKVATLHEWKWWND